MQYVNLVVAWYAMSGQYHPTTVTKWLCSNYGRDSFLTSGVKQRVLRGSAENMTVLLPLDAPAQHCSDEFYAEHLADSMVVLCCDVPGGQVACVALGVFVGDRLWSNTLDPALRFRGRRENFDLSTGLICDANHLLAPVHIFTSLLRPDVVSTLVPSAPLFVDQRLPQQLQLLVSDVQAALTAQQPADGSTQHRQQQLAVAVYHAVECVKGKRSDDVSDGDRVALVAHALTAMRGQLGAAVELAPTRRRNVAQRRNKKRSQEARRLLQACAANTRKSMEQIQYGDYLQLAQVHLLYQQQRGG